MSNCNTILKKSHEIEFDEWLLLKGVLIYFRCFRWLIGYLRASKISRCYFIPPQSPQHTLEHIDHRNQEVSLEFRAGTDLLHRSNHYCWRWVVWPCVHLRRLFARAHIVWSRNHTSTLVSTNSTSRKCISEIQQHSQSLHNG